MGVGVGRGVGFGVGVGVSVGVGVYMGRFSIPSRGEIKVVLSPKTRLAIFWRWPKATRDMAVAREITGVLQVIARIVQSLAPDLIKAIPAFDVAGPFGF